MKNKIENFFISFSLVALMLIMTALCSLIAIFLTGDNLSHDQMFLVTRIAIVLATGVLFYFYYYLFDENLLKIWSLEKLSNYHKKLIFLTLVLCIFWLIYISFIRTIRSNFLIFLVGFLMTSMAEEYMFRGILEHHLEKSFSNIWVIVIQAMLFALMGHQGFDMLTNFLVRFPLGVILSIIRRQTKSYGVAISVHLTYDVSMFIL